MYYTIITYRNHDPKIPLATKPNKNPPPTPKKDKTYEIYWPFVAIIGHSASWNLILKRKRA